MGAGDSYEIRRQLSVCAWRSGTKGVRSAVTSTIVTNLLLANWYLLTNRIQQEIEEVRHEPARGTRMLAAASAGAGLECLRRAR